MFQLPVRATLVGAMTLTSIVCLAQKSPFEKFIGKPVPNFTMTTTDGVKLTPTSLKGKPYIIDFWATWCGPCKDASPLLDKLQKQNGNKGLVVIGANVQDGSRANSKRVSIEYKKANKFSYTMTFDNDAFFRVFGSRGIPFFVFVDRKGVVKDIVLGFSKEQSEPFFNQALKKIL